MNGNMLLHDRQHFPCQICRRQSPAQLLTAADKIYGTGIGREDAEENMTMRICLDELRRCQKLSPKPNFIVLLGERYGWIPLPETMAADKMRALYENVDIGVKYAGGNLLRSC